MIASFGDQGTEDLFHGKSTARSRRIPAALHAAAIRKLDMINAAHTLNDLRSPPGNHLEALSGDFRGHHSIRINAQWRITFRWQASGAHEVKIVDYHA